MKSPNISRFWPDAQWPPIMQILVYVFVSWT